MKLAIVGSQAKSWKGFEHEQEAIRVIEHAIQFLEPDLIISGGANGVDSWAIQVAQEFDIETREFPPEAECWAAYKARNAQIAEACNKLVVIRSQHSLTYGSGWTADYAWKLGKQVWRFTL